MSPMQTTAAHQLNRSVGAAGRHLYLRPSVRPLPRRQVAEAETW
jgi:hypothetical protein